MVQDDKEQKIVYWLITKLRFSYDKDRWKWQFPMIAFEFKKGKVIFVIWKCHEWVEFQPTERKLQPLKNDFQKYIYFPSNTFTKMTL